MDVYDAEAARREEATYRTPGAVERRRRVREVLSPDIGDVVLSLGPGPGFEPAELANDYDVESVIGVERSQAMLALAAERCGADEDVELLAGEATGLPLVDESIDAALSVQVYGYVDALETALSELARVLRPGGSAVVYVTDWETLVWRVGDPELAARVSRTWKSHCVRPRLGSEMTTPLRAAGFHIEPVEPYTICNTTLDGTFAGRWKYGHIGTHTVRWERTVRSRERAGRTFFSLTGSLYHVSKNVG